MIEKCELLHIFWYMSETEAYFSSRENKRGGIAEVRPGRIIRDDKLQRQIESESAGAGEEEGESDGQEHNVKNYIPP